MMKFDRLLFNVLFGITIPVLFFIISWWCTFIFINDQKIIIIASLSGLVTGIIVDVLFKLMKKPDIYGLSKTVLILIYLFYNGILFGMFMGVPFFHLVPGIIAGYYQAKCMIHHNKLTNYTKEIQRMSLFASAIIGIVCLFSGTIAFTNKSTASELRSMFHLPFELSQALLVFLIVTGGILMIVAEYFLVKFTMKKTLSPILDLQ